MSRFLDAIRSGQVLLMDGAMGTELQRAGMGEGECYELWNLTHPQRVRDIHQAYVSAGARCLLTNTFQANPVALAKFGLEDKLEAINQAAIKLARTVCPANGFVLASVGPVGPNKVQFARIMRSLATADAYLLETWDVPPLNFQPRDFWHSWNLTGIPVLFSLTWSHSPLAGQVAIPLNLEVVANWAHQFGIAALGINCGRDAGMDQVIETIRLFRQVTGLPLFARPNAGTPSRVGNRWAYPYTPEQMAARLPELLEVGIAMVGGCCGTTPEHIAAFRPIVEEWNRN